MEKIYKSALMKLAKKISGVSRFYGTWRCPSESVSEQCGPMKNKTDEQCAECIALNAISESTNEEEK